MAGTARFIAAVRARLKWTQQDQASGCHEAALSVAIEGPAASGEIARTDADHDCMAGSPESHDAIKSRVSCDTSSFPTDAAAGVVRHDSHL